MNLTTRIVTASLAFVLLPTVLHASDDIRRRYLVGVDGPAWAFDHPVRRERSFTPFRYVDAFAVELTDAQLIELGKRADVTYIEPDYERHALEIPSRSRAAHLGPGPAPSADGQTMPYGVSLTRADMVWPVTRGAGVKVGVIDTGIDITHPDLVDRYKGGYDFYNRDDVPQDDNGHGTHVSGIIGASDNTIGVVGVAPEVDLYGLKVLDANGSGSTSTIIGAVEWAITNQLDVINMSFGGGSFSTTENNEFNKARSAGIICVAASGNSHPNVLSVDYPASYDAVIAVGAVDSNEVVASFSQRGVQLELMGAGVSVNSTVIAPNAYRIHGDSFSDVYGQPMTYSPTPDEASGLMIASGIGNPGEFPAGVSGNVALIQRGTLTFNQKAQNAESAGAIAAIIYNNVPGGFLGTLCSDTSNCTPPNVPTNPILTVSVSKEDGEMLVGRDGSAIAMTRGSQSTYAVQDGTSMASPHVAGVAALMRGLACPEEIRNAMDMTATDLGAAGRDTTYGFGLVDAYAAGTSLAPWRFHPVDVGSRRHAVRRPLHCG